MPRLWSAVLQSYFGVADLLAVCRAVWSTSLSQLSLPWGTQEQLCTNLLSRHKRARMTVRSGYQLCSDAANFRCLHR